MNDEEKPLKKGHQLIGQSDNAIYVSHISLWKIQIKAMTGKFHLDLKSL
ncbi:MAG: hypothetical protein ACU88J_12455 [Gammaproteobacteria bacterium]